MGHKICKTIVNQDGRLRVHIIKRDDHTFTFLEEELVTSYAGTSCWTPIAHTTAGIYETSDLAEQEAKSKIVWLF